MTDQSPRRGILCLWVKVGDTRGGREGGFELGEKAVTCSISRTGLNSEEGKW